MKTILLIFLFSFKCLFVSGQTKDSVGTYIGSTGIDIISPKFSGYRFYVSEELFLSDNVYYEFTIFSLSFYSAPGEKLSHSFNYAFTLFLLASVWDPGMFEVAKIIMGLLNSGIGYRFNNWSLLCSFKNDLYTGEYYLNPSFSEGIISMKYLLFSSYSISSNIHIPINQKNKLIDKPFFQLGFSVDFYK